MEDVHFCVWEKESRGGRGDREERKGTRRGRGERKGGREKEKCVEGHAWSSPRMDRTLNLFPILYSIKMVFCRFLTLSHPYLDLTRDPFLLNFCTDYVMVKKGSGSDLAIIIRWWVY